MLKVVITLSFLLAVVQAGYIGTPLAYSAPIIAAPAPLPLATSYQNTFKISTSPLVVKSAPLLAAAVHHPAAIISSPAIIKSAPLVLEPSYHHGYAAYH